MAVASAQQRRGMRLVFGVLAAVAIAGFGLLGRWQWHRADEKRVLERAFAAGLAAAPAPLGSQALASLSRYAHIEVRGSYDAVHQFLLDNISHDGRAGYEALTPFLLDDGRTTLVNRGWLPLTDGGRDQWPDIELGAAANRVQTITARVDDLPVTGLASGRAAPTADTRWPKLTSFPRATELAAALGKAIEPRQLLLDAGQPAGYRRDWQPASVGFGPERHIAYAIQWWSLALLVCVIYVYMSVRQPRD